MDEIAKRATKIIAEQLGMDEHKITPDKKLGDDLGCDSLDFVELAMALEDEFAIVIYDEEEEHCATVQGVIDTVARLIEEQEA